MSSDLRNAYAYLSSVFDDLQHHLETGTFDGEWFEETEASLGQASLELEMELDHLGHRPLPARARLELATLRRCNALLSGIRYATEAVREVEIESPPTTTAEEFVAFLATVVRGGEVSGYHG